MDIFPEMLQAYGLDSVKYKIVTPDEFRCQKSAANVLVFQKDKEAIQQIAASHCSQNSFVKTSMLSPDITFF